MPSFMSAAKESSSGRRATPTMENSLGSRPCCSRWKSAGSSLRLVKSPDAPKITTTPGSGMRSLGRDAACIFSGAIFTSVVAMEFSLQLLISRRDVWSVFAAFDPAVLSSTAQTSVCFNPQRCQVARNLLRALTTNCMNSHRGCRFSITHAIVDENHFFRFTLQYIESHPKDLRIRLAQHHVTGAEKEIEISAQPESLNPIIIQLARLVIQ